ncbi:MAG: pilus assembly PilX N-terminal domain-containing protein [Atribacterota bacterium]|nr:pilus assembly PilX N-terminal domain-containing protein [Atribacterota bacterium]MDD4289571.1 pilus assembly PilX N-terminal domain-containing protein [Atribacterota bacterium]
MKNILRSFYINKNGKILKSQNGMALLSVLIFTFVLVSIVIAMLVMAQNDTKLSTLQRDSTKAFYLAESGVEEMLWKLNTSGENGGIELPDDLTIDDPRWPDYGINHSGSEDEYYEVSIEPLPEDDPRRETGEKIKDWVVIKSTGVVEGNGEDVTGKRTIQVVAHFTITQRTSVLYDKAILTDHMITFQGNPGATITGGDIHSNYGIEVKGPYEFDGTATTSGIPDDYPNTPYSALNDLDDTDNGDFSGPGNWPAMDIPPVPYDELKAMAEANGTYYPNGFDSKDYGRGDYEFTGVVYVEGDVVFRNGDSLTINDGALVVAKTNPDDPNDSSGTMEFKNGSNLTINRSDPVPEGAYPGPIALAAMGDVLLHASSSSLNGVVQSGGYYNDEGELMPGGMVDFRNDSVVTGAVVAEEVWMHNKTTINYDGDFMENFTTVTTLGNARYDKVSWQEI